MRQITLSRSLSLVFAIHVLYGVVCVCLDVAYWMSVNVINVFWPQQTFNIINIQTMTTNMQQWKQELEHIHTQIIYTCMTVNDMNFEVSQRCTFMKTEIRAVSVWMWVFHWNKKSSVHILKNNNSISIFDLIMQTELIYMSIE